MKAIGHRKNDAQAEATHTRAHTDAVSPYFSTSCPVEFLPDDRLIHSANKWLGSSSSLPPIWQSAFSSVFLFLLLPFFRERNRRKRHSDWRHTQEEQEAASRSTRGATHTHNYTGTDDFFFFKSQPAQPGQHSGQATLDTLTGKFSSFPEASKARLNKGPHWSLQPQPKHPLSYYGHRPTHSNVSTLVKRFVY